MELNELHIRQRQTSSSHHGVTITSTSMSGCAGLIGSSIATTGNDSVKSSYSVDCSISNAHDCDSSADTIVVHNEVKSEIFDEEGTVVCEGSTE